MLTVDCGRDEVAIAITVLVLSVLWLLYSGTDVRITQCVLAYIQSEELSLSALIVAAIDEFSVVGYGSIFTAINVSPDNIDSSFEEQINFLSAVSVLDLHLSTPELSQS